MYCFVVILYVAWIFNLCCHINGIMSCIHYATAKHSRHLDSQLMSGVNRRLVHHTVVLQPEILQLAVVSKSPPLRVHAHTAFLSFHQLHGPHLLHVARITAGA